MRLNIRKTYEADRSVTDRMKDGGPEVYDAEVLQNFFNQITIEVKWRQAIGRVGPNVPVPIASTLRYGT